MGLSAPMLGSVSQGLGSGLWPNPLTLERPNWEIKGCVGCDRELAIWAGGTLCNILWRITIATKKVAGLTMVERRRGWWVTSKRFQATILGAPFGG